MRERICGIYYIKNIKNNKLYIGQSVDIYTRWVRHKGELNNNMHFNSHLQCAWNKYGADSFEFEILERCKKNQLNDREKYWIAKYKTANDNYGYNRSKGGNIDFADCVKRKVKPNETYGEHTHSSKLSEDDVLDIIKRMQNDERNKDIAKLYNISMATVCNIRQHRAYSHLTEGLDLTHSKEFFCYMHMSHKIDMYDLDGNLIRTFRSLSSIQKEMHINRRAITRVCQGSLHMFHGYVWRYHDEPFDKYSLKPVNHVVVDQYDLNWNYVATYDNMRLAGNAVGVNRGTVEIAVKNMKRTAGGYHWLRHGEVPPIKVA